MSSHEAHKARPGVELVLFGASKRGQGSEAGNGRQDEFNLLVDANNEVREGHFLLKCVVVTNACRLKQSDGVPQRTR